MRINLLNIGCFKNLVDSERLLRVFSDAGMEVCAGELQDTADVAIINTCGFIGEAEDESLSCIRRYAGYRKAGRIGALWIMGCYSQKYGDALYGLVPEIDRVFGNFDWENMPSILGIKASTGMERYLTTPSHYAFVKISDGCSQSCSYCIKPVLNGPLSSVPVEDIIRECRWLVSQGVHEIQLVAQNLTAYGQDLYGRKKIADLLRRISDIPGISWIRLHYGYPAGFPKDLLEVIRERDNVCKYLDMAIQHSETRMLKLMRRGMDKESLVSLLSFIRDEVPGICLRTTVMVGHPGETEDDFENLYRFVESQRFGRLGVFRYSHQKGTYADRHYTDDIPSEVKDRRALKIMDLQNRIYREMNRESIGSNVDVIIDSRTSDGKYIARSQYSTPVADPYVIVSSGENVQTGHFYSVRITGSNGRNLLAEL